MNATRAEKLMRFLQRYAEPAFLLLRATAGLMFAFHGLQKIFGVFSDHPADFPGQMWFGGVIEIVSGFLMAAGLWTRCAAFIASGTMAVAYTQFHWKLAMGKEFGSAAENRTEAVCLRRCLRGRRLDFV